MEANLGRLLAQSWKWLPVCYYGHVASCFAPYCVQRSPTGTLCALSAENLSRTLAWLAFVYLVPDSSSLSLNLGDCTAYGLQRPAGVPVCTAGARKVLLKRGSCILMYSLVNWIIVWYYTVVYTVWLQHRCTAALLCVCLPRGLYTERELYLQWPCSKHSHPNHERDQNQRSTGRNSKLQHVCAWEWGRSD